MSNQLTMVLNGFKLALCAGFFCSSSGLYAEDIDQTPVLKDSQAAQIDTMKGLIDRQDQQLDDQQKQLDLQREALQSLEAQLSAMDAAMNSEQVDSDQAKSPAAHSDDEEKSPEEMTPETFVSSLMGLDIERAIMIAITTTTANSMELIFISVARKRLAEEITSALSILTTIPQRKSGKYRRTVKTSLPR